MQTGFARWYTIMEEMCMLYDRLYETAQTYYILNVIQNVLSDIIYGKTIVLCKQNYTEPAANVVKLLYVNRITLYNILNWSFNCRTIFNVATAIYSMIYSMQYSVFCMAYYIGQCELDEIYYIGVQFAMLY